MFWTSNLYQVPQFLLFIIYLNRLDHHYQEEVHDEGRGAENRLEGRKWFGRRDK